MDELLVHKLLVRDSIAEFRNSIRVVGVFDPLPALPLLFFVEGEVDPLPVSVSPLELLEVVVDIFKVLTALLRRRRSQALIVLDPPTFRAVLKRFFPLLVLPHAPETDLFIAFEHLDQRRHKHADEVRLGPEKFRPEVSDEIDHQPLDVASVGVLVGHDHDPTVPQRPNLLFGRILLGKVQAHDGAQILDLSVGAENLLAGVADVEYLSPQREHAELLPSYDLEAGNSQGLGRVALSQHEGALVPLVGPRPVGVIELWHVDAGLTLHHLELLFKLAISVRFDDSFEVFHEFTATEPVEFGLRNGEGRSIVARI
mmetsp:Transcript_7476/g.15550  ORF Transcript_7476/g.15550 Transcript_7476/m.15550 type:complete len:313 (-) Transcript_7476:1310-2248(-)